MSDRTDELNDALAKLQVVNAELQRLSNTDGLTQVGNRAYFDLALTSEHKRASRLKQTIGELGVDALGAAGLRWRSPPSYGSSLAATLVPEYCNSRAFTIFGGAAEIQLGLIGKTVLGL